MELLASPIFGTSEPQPPPPNEGSPLGLSLPAIHKHIKLLENAEIVKRRKIGRTNYEKFLGKHQSNLKKKRSQQ